MDYTPNYGLKKPSPSDTSEIISDLNYNWDIIDEALSNHNHDTTYVRKGTADTITAQHTFNPSTAGAPFILGTNAQNQLVTGLNADKVDGYDASDLDNSALLYAIIFGG